MGRLLTPLNGVESFRATAPLGINSSISTARNKAFGRKSSSLKAWRAPLGNFIDPSPQIRRTAQLVICRHGIERSRMLNNYFGGLLRRVYQRQQAQL